MQLMNIERLFENKNDTGTDGVPGAPTSLDVHSKLVKDLALFSISAINRRLLPYILLLVEILNATQQVDAGTKYVINVLVEKSTCAKPNPLVNCQLDPNAKVQRCRIEIFEQPWLNRKEVIGFYCGREEDKKDVRNKQDTGTDGVPGAPTSLDVHSKLVKDLALFSISAINRRLLPYILLLVEILNATQQVDAGTKYVINVLVEKSTCAKPNPLVNCQLDPNAKVQRCRIEIFEQSWLNRKEVIGFYCGREEDKKDVRNKQDTGTDAGIRIIYGAPTKIDVHSKLARDLALFFIFELNKIVFPYNFFLVDILSGTQQVVSGIKYVMDVLVGNVSGCREGTPADNCQLKSNVKLHECNFEIIEQPWLNRKEVIGFDCYPEEDKKDVRNKQEFIE
ncbi:uncharacterized protein LOC142325337 isoform X2 [Lycorma delicatula]|uniref:uncharacterized protein LOC142325337 isoform X2 n=1 Tax=Lycorma delicatula TaxID=130591 RepID=UPI003F50F71F